MQHLDPRAAARTLLVLALAAGIVGDVLLDGPAPGVNVLLMTVGVLVLGWLVRRRGRAPDPLDAWLPITAVVLAAGIGFRADPFVGLLDLMGAGAFTCASVAAFSGLAITRRSLSAILAIGILVVGSAVAGIVPVLAAARPVARQEPRRLPGWAAPVARGLVLMIPLVLILAVLFASADPIFRRAVDGFLGFRIDLGDLPGRLLMAIGIAWIVGGLLAVAARGLPAVEGASLGAAAPARSLSWERTLGSTEAVVVLVGVDLVVGLFVGLQLAYLFGGLDTLAAVGMTYSAYARRGYFELVAAAGLSGGILVALEYLAVRSRAYLAMATVLVGLTLVVLASAALRLQLYQDAYGWTELRLYVAVSIAAMAATLITLAVFLLRDRTRWLGHAMVVIGVVALVGLNLIAPAAFVAERNLQRVIDPSLVPPDGEATLDADYLAVLPDDAIPAIVAALPHLPADEAGRMRSLLLQRRAELQGDPAFASPFAWNLGRERARAALAALQ